MLARGMDENRLVAHRNLFRKRVQPDRYHGLRRSAPGSSARVGDVCNQSRSYLQRVPDRLRHIPPGDLQPRRQNRGKIPVSLPAMTLRSRCSPRPLRSLHGSYLSALILYTLVALAIGGSYTTGLDASRRTGTRRPAREWPQDSILRAPLSLMISLSC